jgi:hypothetical protein
VSYKDSIDDLIRDRPVTIGKLSWAQEFNRSWRAAIYGWLFLIVGIMATLGATGALLILAFGNESDKAAFEQESNRVVFFLVIGPPAWFFGLKLKKASSIALAQQESERQWDLDFSRRMSELSLNQRLVFIDKLSQVEIEYLHTQGLLGAAELEHLKEEGRLRLSADEAKKVRKHEAEESRLGRKHEKTKSRDQQRADFKLAKTRLDKELQIWESKLKIAHPSEVDRIREKVDAFSLESVTRATIEAMPEGDEKWRMMDAWERRVANK